MEKALNDEVYKVWYSADDSCVMMNWHGYANSRQFREGTELMLSELIANKAHKVLGDIKNMVLIGQDDQSWLLSDFFPRAIKAGCKAFALVRPDYYFNKIAVETVNHKVGDQVQIRMFDELAQASEWLSGID